MKEFIKDKIREGLLTEERIKLDMPIPSDIKNIKDVFKGHGYKLYVVGGAVRDALLGKTPKDYDLATDAVPDKVESMMAEAGLKTIATGKQFGVINVFTDTDEYEIATFRSDSKEGDGRRPDSVSFTDIEGDVKRRDLTINALFYDIDTNEVVDLVGGVSDLKNGIVKTVGSANDRFEEDRLRILRAIRFAGRFGSDLDPEVDAALQNDASLENISGERIRDEFLKGIKSAKSVKQFLSLIDKYNLFQWVFKGLNVNKGFIEDEDVMIVLATLLKGNDIDTLRKKLNELKYSVDEIKLITFLIALLQLSVDTAVTLKKAENNVNVSPDQINNFGGRENIDPKLLKAFNNFNLSVNGQDVMNTTGIKAGPELGKMIHKMETDNFKKML